MWYARYWLDRSSMNWKNFYRNTVFLVDGYFVGYIDKIDEAVVGKPIKVKKDMYDLIMPEGQKPHAKARGGFFSNPMQPLPL